MRAVVVSGAGQGLGRIVAEQLVEAGYKVYAGVLQKAEVDDWRCEAVVQRRLVPRVLDVTSDTNIEQLVQAIEQDRESHPLHAVIHVAGIAQFDAFELLDKSALRRLFEVNTFGAFALTRALLPELKRTRGRIIAVSSVAASTPVPLQGGYGASKAALESLFDSLRVELCPWRVPVVLVAPGGIRTGMVTYVQRALGESLARCQSQPELQAYSPAYEATQRGIREAGPCLLDPAKVAALLVRVSQLKNPSSRYLIGRDARLLVGLRSLLPDALWDRLMGSKFALR